MDSGAAVIGLIGTGDMGAAIGAALNRQGVHVVSCLAGRSAHSRELAAAAGIQEMESLNRVVSEAQLLLSIVPPAAAWEVANKVGAAIQATNSRAAYADCNAIAPDTMQRIAAHLESLGAVVVDVGIVGRGPPTSPPTRLYYSGPQTQVLLQLESPELRLINLGTQIGAASGLKMAYAALNKGTDALHTMVLLLAEQLGVRPALMQELAVSQKGALVRMEGRVPFLAATAQRYVGEMEEIAATCSAVGITPRFHQGSAWLYAALASTQLAMETRATVRRDRTLDEAIEIFRQALESCRPPEPKSPKVPGEV